MRKILVCDWSHTSARMVNSTKILLRCTQKKEKEKEKVKEVGKGCLN